MRNNNVPRIPLGSGLRKVGRDEGDTFDVAGARFVWKVKGEDTGYAFSIYEQEFEPGEGVPLHCHAYAEVFYELSGSFDFLQVSDDGEEWTPCAGGEVVVIPTNSPHAFYNRTDQPAQLLSISTQLHQAFFDAVEDADRANPVAQRPGRKRSRASANWPGVLICTSFHSHRRHRGVEYRAELRSSMSARRVFDYDIVGAGSAGCVLAARLSRDPNVRVALVEAGGPDDAPEISMPVAFPQLFKTKYDWDFATGPEPGPAQSGRVPGRRLPARRRKRRPKPYDRLMKPRH